MTEGYIFLPEQIQGTEGMKLLGTGQGVHFEARAVAGDTCAIKGHVGDRGHLTWRFGYADNKNPES